MKKYKVVYNEPLPPAEEGIFWIPSPEYMKSIIKNPKNKYIKILGVFMCCCLADQGGLEITAQYLKSKHPQDRISLKTYESILNELHENGFLNEIN